MNLIVPPSVRVTVVILVQLANKLPYALFIIVGKICENPVIDIKF